MQLTIIIPTYNRSNVLRHVILSLVNQGIERYEVIICDDGSSDDTKQVIKQLCKDHDLPFLLKYLWQEHKSFRAGQARNMGIDIATGERLMFLDQDVILMPRTLEKFCKITGGTYCWTGTKNLVPLDFYKNNITDDVVLQNFDVFFEQKFGSIPATLSSFGIIIKKDFEKVKCFDQDFIGYGLEDTELVNRLQDIGIKSCVNPNCFGFHIAHDYEKQICGNEQIYHYKRTNTKRDGKTVRIEED